MTRNSNASQSRARPRSRAHLPHYLVTVLLLGLGVHLLLPQLTSLQHSFTVLKEMVWWVLGLAVLAQIVSYVGSGLVVRSLANLAGKRISLLHSMVVTIASGSVGMVAGGIVGVGAASYHWLRERGVEPESAALAGSLPVWLNNGVMALVASFGLLHLLARGSLAVAQIIGYVLVLAIIALVLGTLIWSLGHREATAQVADWIGRHWARLRRRQHDPTTVHAGVARFFAAWDLLRAGAWRWPVLGAALNNGFDMLCLYLLFASARHSVDLGVLLTGYGLPLLLGKMVFLPGGVGVVEASMTALYRGLGVPSGVIVVVILVYRLLSFWFPSILGFLFIPYLNRLANKGSATVSDH
jgi:glycosyltransferase 2 family protein